MDAGRGVPKQVTTSNRGVQLAFLPNHAVAFASSRGLFPAGGTPLSATLGMDNEAYSGITGVGVVGIERGNVSAFDPSRRGLTTRLSRSNLQIGGNDEPDVGKKRAASPGRSMSRSISTEHLYMNKTTSHTYVVSAAGSH